MKITVNDKKANEIVAKMIDLKNNIEEAIKKGEQTVLLHKQVNLVLTTNNKEMFGEYVKIIEEQVKTSEATIEKLKLRLALLDELLASKDNDTIVKTLVVIGAEQIEKTDVKIEEAVA